MRVNEIEWKQEMKWEKDYKSRPQNAVSLFQLCSKYEIFRSIGYVYMLLSGIFFHLPRIVCEWVRKSVEEELTAMRRGEKWKLRITRTDYLIMKFYWIFFLPSSFGVVFWDEIELRCSHFARAEIWYVELICLPSSDSMMMMMLDSS